MKNDEDFLMDFAPDHPPTSGPGNNAEPWKIMIVDDEEEVHAVTTLALQGFELHGRGLEFLHAYSGEASIEMLRENPDTALILMDVVMETEHAGLDAVKQIRQELDNHFVRIILRTGQPGQAPEREVVSTYDINDYKEKTELTATKLFTLMHTGLSLYRELVAMDRSRQGLEKVIAASSTIFELKSFSQFAKGVLQQLGALLYTRRDAMIVTEGITASIDDSGEFKVLVGVGQYEKAEGANAPDVLDPEGLLLIKRALKSRSPQISDRHFAQHFVTKNNNHYVVYLATDSRIDPDDEQLVELFCQSVGLAFENMGLHEEVVQSQRQMIMLLSGSIEERSTDLRNHVERVAGYSELLGRLYGLPEEDVELLSVGAAMHDIGKISVPEAILNKPGRLTDEERAEMELHVERGDKLLEGQSGEILSTARIVVSQHHEQWNGRGYPLGLKGEGIHLYGRIAAIADVFDALTTTRCYKQPWPIEDVMSYFRKQAGVQFDPDLVRLFLANIDEVLAIKARLSVKSSQTVPDLPRQ